MSDFEEKFLSWKVSATTKAELEKVMAEMKAQRGGRKVTQDEVTLALLSRPVPKTEQTAAPSSAVTKPEQINPAQPVSHPQSDTVASAVAAQVVERSLTNALAEIEDALTILRGGDRGGTTGDPATTGPARETDAPPTEADSGSDIHPLLRKPKRGAGLRSQMP